MGSAPSKDKKEKQESAKEGHMKKNEDMDRDKEDSKPISQPTVDGSDDVDGRNKINKRNDSEVERKSEDKNKNEKILPNHTQEGIRTKLKKTKNVEITESPLEKLRRLENEKPTEVETVEEEIVISELPS